MIIGKDLGTSMQSFRLGGRLPYYFGVTRFQLNKKIAYNCWHVSVFRWENSLVTISNTNNLGRTLANSFGLMRKRRK
jgi:hypothetical protein